MTVRLGHVFLVVTSVQFTACTPKLTKQDFKTEDGALLASWYINKQGLREGPYTEYFENGQPNYTCTYLRDSMDGIFTCFFENGQMHYKLEYRMNRLWNVIEMRDDAGNNLDHGTVSNGEGLFIGYNDKGKKRRSGMCRAGLKSGYWHLFNNAPNFIDSVLYIEGRRQDNGRLELMWF